MSTTTVEIDMLAYDFVLEYLEREPEFLDVAEFVEEAGSDVDPADVYKEVVAYLGDHAQRFGDLND